MTERPIPRRLLGAATRSADELRRLTSAGLQERIGDPADVDIAVGQVWRARWEQIAVLVLVVGVADRRVDVMPVTIDPPAEDDRCVVVAGAVTAFGVDATAWGGMRSSIPVRVLDRLIDAWPSSIVDAVTRHGPAEAAVRAGRAIASNLDPDALFRAELADDVQELAEVPLLVTEDQVQRQPKPLRVLLGRRLDLAKLQQAVGLMQPMVMRLISGKLPLSSAQVEQVAAATGLAVAEVEQSVLPLPPGLGGAAEHPRWRPTWTQRARQLGVSEPEAQLSGSYGTFALATRSTGGGEPDWNERLRYYLQTTADPPDGA